MSALAEPITSSGQWSLLNFQNSDFWLKILLMSTKEANESSLTSSRNLQRKPQSKPLSCTIWYCYRSYQGLNLDFPLDYGKFTRVALLQTEHRRHPKQGLFPKQDEKKNRPGEIYAWSFFTRLHYTQGHILKVISTVSQTLAAKPSSSHYCPVRQESFPHVLFQICFWMKTKTYFSFPFQSLAGYQLC